MTKYNAYEVLGIEADASVDEIKAAYAELSKKYHPEENPEKFQQIHEAYVTLTRRRKSITNLWLKSEPQSKQRFNFDACVIKESEEISQELQLQIDEAIKNLCRKFSGGSIYIESKLLQEVMDKEKSDVLLSKAYVKKLYGLLQDREIDPNSYKVIFEYMRLWDKGLILEREDLAHLKKFLDMKREYAFTPQKQREYIILSSILFIVILIMCFIDNRLF